MAPGPFQGFEFVKGTFQVKISNNPVIRDLQFEISRIRIMRTDGHEYKRGGGTPLLNLEIQAACSKLASDGLNANIDIPIAQKIVHRNLCVIS